MSQQFMEVARDCLGQVRSKLNCTLTTIQTNFNLLAASIDFPLFCLIYAILLIWLLRRLNRTPIFRPNNKELVDWKTRMKKELSSFIVGLPIIKQIVRKKFDKGIQELEVEIAKDLEKGRDPAKSNKLPLEGMKKQNLEARINKWSQAEQKRMLEGKLSGTFYPYNVDHCKAVCDFAAKYMYQNPLHLDAHKELSKLEAEVLRMTGSMISKERTYGVITSGGSESLIMSLYAYKKAYPRQRPNVVVPHSVHAAIDKGAAYFNIEVRKARLNQYFEVDVQHMEELIDGNTIALYGSYPNYPHGIIDPIRDIAELAKKYKVGFHVDGCLGGFIAAFLPEHKEKFTMDIDGVTSMSLDHHKFGLAPKGISGIFWKTKELRQNMYFFYSDWVGGLYGTPSFVGSRPGFPSAGAWYSMTQLGRQVFNDNATELSTTTKKIAEELRKIEGVKVFGNPEICVVAFDTTIVDIYAVADHLEKNKNWHLAAIHLPRGVHIGITLSNIKNVKQNLVKDVAEAVELLKKHEQKQSQTAAIYGATAKLPQAQMGEQMLRSLMKVCFR